MEVDFGSGDELGVYLYSGTSILFAMVGSFGFGYLQAVFYAIRRLFFKFSSPSSETHVGMRSYGICELVNPVLIKFKADELS